MGDWASKDIASGSTKHALNACSSGCALWTEDATVCMGSFVLDACSCVYAMQMTMALFLDAAYGHHLAPIDFALMMLSQGSTKALPLLDILRLIMVASTANTCATKHYSTAFAGHLLTLTLTIS